MASGTDDLDPIIHPANRLRICAMLHAAQEVEFAVVQEHLGVSASVLSKQLTHLADAGYVTQRRVVRGARSRVWLQLTGSGRSAYERHIRALHSIVEQAAQPAGESRRASTDSATPTNTNA